MDLVHLDPHDNTKFRKEPGFSLLVVLLADEAGDSEQFQNVQIALNFGPEDEPLEQYEGIDKLGDDEFSLTDQVVKKLGNSSSVSFRNYSFARIKFEVWTPTLQKGSG